LPALATISGTPAPSTVSRIAPRTPDETTPTITSTSSCRISFLVFARPTGGFTSSSSRTISKVAPLSAPKVSRPSAKASSMSCPSEA